MSNRHVSRSVAECRRSHKIGPLSPSHKRGYYISFNNLFIQNHWLATHVTSRSDGTSRSEQPASSYFGHLTLLHDLSSRAPHEIGGHQQKPEWVAPVLRSARSSPIWGLFACTLHLPSPDKQKLSKLKICQPAFGGPQKSDFGRFSMLTAGRCVAIRCHYYRWGAWATPSEDCLSGSLSENVG